MKVQLARFIFLIAASLSIACAWGHGTDPLPGIADKPPQQPGDSVDVRTFADQFRAVTLPALHLEGKTTREAIDVVGKLGFHCEIDPEAENIVRPAQPLMPYVECTRLFPDKAHIAGLLWLGLFLENWTGDGTLLSTRFDDLAHALVRRTNVSRFPYPDNRDAPSSRQASPLVAQALAATGANQPVADFVKYAMTHRIACRAAAGSGDQRDALECMTMKPTPGCLLAVFQADVTDARDGAAPLSLWSADREIPARAGSWACVKSRTN